MYLNFIKEKAKLVPRALLSYMRTCKFLRTVKKCEKHSAAPRASLCTSLVFFKIPLGLYNSRKYKKLKQSPANVTALAEMDLPSSQGTKRSKSMQIRKGGKNTNKHPRQVIESYLEPNSEIPTAPIVTEEATTSSAVINAITPQVPAVASHWSAQTEPVVSFKFAQLVTDYVYT